MWHKIFSCLLDQKFMDICFERYGNVHFGNTFRKIRVNYSAMKFNIYQVIITFYACLLWHTLSYVCIAITNPLLYYLFYVRLQRSRRKKKNFSCWMIVWTVISIKSCLLVIRISIWPFNDMLQETLIIVAIRVWVDTLQQHFYFLMERNF